MAMRSIQKKKEFTNRHRIEHLCHYIQIYICIHLNDFISIYIYIILYKYKYILYIRCMVHLPEGTEVGDERKDGDEVHPAEE